MRQSSLLIEPKIGFLQEFVNAVFRKKLGRDSAQSTFVRNRFSTIFTKFCEMAMIVGTRPRTALAIKAMNLIELEQSESAPRYSHSSHHVTQGLDDRRNTGRGLVAPSLLGRISFYRRLCSWNGATRRKVPVRSIVLCRAPFHFLHSNMSGR